MNQSVQPIGFNWKAVPAQLFAEDIDHGGELFRPG